MTKVVQQVIQYKEGRNCSMNIFLFVRKKNLKQCAWLAARKCHEMETMLTLLTLLIIINHLQSYCGEYKQFLKKEVTKQEEIITANSQARLQASLKQITPQDLSEGWKLFPPDHSCTKELTYHMQRWFWLIAAFQCFEDIGFKFYRLMANLELNSSLHYFCKHGGMNVMLASWLLDESHTSIISLQRYCHICNLGKSKKRWCV